MTEETDQRYQQLAQRLAAVQQRIDQAATAAGREDTPQLIVVTKYFPAADVQHQMDLGVVDIGENKDQEAASKSSAVASQRSQTESPRWHFIGQLQSNKAKSVARYAAAVHSVDRPKLVGMLSRGIAEAKDAGLRSTDLDCLIQVDLRPAAENDGRGGATPDRVFKLAQAISETDHVQLKGLMAVAPLDEPAAEAFARLQALAAQVREEYPEADWLSAGMSQDLEEAVLYGATHLRIGRDVLGERPYAR